MVASCKKKVSWASTLAVPFFYSPHLPINGSTTSPTARTTHHASPHWWTTIAYKKKPIVSKPQHSLKLPRSSSRRPFQHKLCFQCLAPDHLLRDCREPRRCSSYKMLGHSSASCRRRLKEIEASSPLPRASPPPINHHSMLASALEPLGTSTPPSFSIRPPSSSFPPSSAFQPPFHHFTPGRSDLYHHQPRPQQHSRLLSSSHKQYSNHYHSTSATPHLPKRERSPSASEIQPRRRSASRPPAQTAGVTPRFPNTWKHESDSSRCIKARD